MKNKRNYKNISFTIFGLLTLSLLSKNFESKQIEVKAAEGEEYNESYRNHLAFSAKRGWNNDPNGLIYVNGVYHMYYQYNYDQRNNSTDNGWGNMSWGHATSTDLVHWEEKPVAIPAYQDVNGQHYAMMFSGSCVYDINNTSGLFSVKSDGTVVDGHGMVALLTQPTNVQRQILVYSHDGGNSFKIHGEILSGDPNAAWSLKDDEFRDPKVFYSDDHKKWLMAVGGGAVRMFSSTNLLNWDYLGQTGYWGECPDISKYIVDGETKYALILSPEDKPKSHQFNQTTRESHFYPAEYYTVGDLDESGLFVAEQPLVKLSEGMDSYAFQSFNDSPEGKVYGLSWSASWKNVENYRGFRKTHNGGMTIACEMNMLKDEQGYRLTRNPVEAFNTLRNEEIYSFEGNLDAGINALKDIDATMADLNIELDFNNSTANNVELNLRKSLVEKVKITYDKKEKRLIFDRSESSLLAQNTIFQNWKNVIENVELQEGKLKLRILLDRAFINVFVNDGKGSIFSAIFPSAISNEMSLMTDQKINVKADIYSLNSIYGEITPVDEKIVTTDKLDLVVGEEKAVVISSFKEELNDKFFIKEGRGIIELYQQGQIAKVKAVSSGTAKIQVADKEIIIFVYEDNYVSDINFDTSWFGYSYKNDNGLVIDYGADAFLFSNNMVEDVIYSADININEEGQAAGLVFGVSDNFYDYHVVTVDFKDNLIKLWRAGVGDLKVKSYDFSQTKTCNVKVSVYQKEVKIYIDNETTPSLTHILNDYKGGKLGINVYNSSTAFNNIKLEKHSEELTFDGTTNIDLGSYENVIKIVNVTDSSYRLLETDYVYENNTLTLSKEYLLTLDGNKQYQFRIVTESDNFDKNLNTSFTEVKINLNKTDYTNDEQIIVTVEDAKNINAVYLNDKLIEDYTKNGSTITISNDLVNKLTTGSHKITILTDHGRPTVEFNIIETFDFEQEEIEANHIFFFIDIGIFAAFIIGYIAFSIIKKKKGVE